MLQLAKLYQQFDPLIPLEADPEGDALYVDWQKELGPDDIKKQLATEVALSGGIPQTRLFTGHRGVGKTTELKRVKRTLEEGKFGQRMFVSFVEAEAYLDLSDVQAPEVIFSMVRQVVTDLQKAGFDLAWTKFVEFFNEFRELASREVELKNLKIGAGPVEFGLALKEVPSARPVLRRLIEDRLPNIYQLINEVILTQAFEWLKKKNLGEGILIVIDQLDRIPQKIINDRGLTNHENLYLDSAKTLRALNCDVLYTIPIELAYSRCRGRLQSTYGSEILTLPMMPVVDRKGRENERGVGALRTIVDKRAGRAGVGLASFFAETRSIDRLARLSGGHVPTFLSLIRASITRSGALPITQDSIESVVRRWAGELAVPVKAHEWDAIKQVHRTNEGLNREEDSELWNALLRERFVYNYRDGDEIWYDWNPLLGELRRES